MSLESPIAVHGGSTGSGVRPVPAGASRFGRLHLLEIHEQPWCPPSLRMLVTAFLETFARRMDVYGPMERKLFGAIRQGGGDRVLDLCSGSGGPWLSLLAKHGKKAPEVLLSDAFPNPGALSERVENEGRLAYHPEPVDARAVPGELRGFRTLFAALHHFRPEEAESILRDAVDAGHGIAALEPSRRCLPSMLAILAIPLALLLMAPFLRPFRWSRLFWTYLIPALPLVLVLDGWVSCLRTYTPTELRCLTEAADPEGLYHWESGLEGMGGLPLKVTYLLGWPRSQDRQGGDASTP